MYKIDELKKNLVSGYLTKTKILIKEDFEVNKSKSCQKLFLK